MRGTDIAAIVLAACGVALIGIGAVVDLPWDLPGFFVGLGIALVVLGLLLGPGMWLFRYIAKQTRVDPR